MRDTLERGSSVPVRELELASGEVRAVLLLIDGLRERYADPTDLSFLEHAATAGRHLPARVLDFLAALRYQECHAAGVIRGFPVAEAELPPTPAHWRDRAAVVDGPEDFWLTLVTAQLGDLVSWASLQDGRLLNDIHPITGQERQQTGHSSDVVLDLHVEDAFHEHRCDNLALLCLRNPHGTATTVVGVEAVDVSAAEFDVLFEARYLIDPDDEHRRNLTAFGVAAGFQPVAAPVLYGSRADPYIRLDPPYMRAVPGDARAAEALRTLIGLLSDHVTDVVLEPGDLLLVDNHRALHGRRPFPARHDGTDRWLRRATTVRDLRRSRPFRPSARDRVVHPVMP
ncbi:TauD/TfdA family dioxygenase, partial [Micromonospora sp. URMC 107]|uniref:TauD/TfdA family dioxygenase n=1 Tax=Micromonospora sp. URMC 107 TaxID=3423418 RepID=UPI003F1A3C3E